MEPGTFDPAKLTGLRFKAAGLSASDAPATGITEEFDGMGLI